MIRETLTSEQLQQLVVRVVTEVLRAERGRKLSESGAVADDSRIPASPSVPSFVNEFDGSVLTAQVAESFTKSQPLRVAMKTVITPSASDILKLRDIRLVRGGYVGHQRTGGIAVRVADAEGLRRCAALARQLASRNHDGVRGVGFKELLSLTSENEVRGIVIADRPHAVVWRLHREAGLRAAQVSVLDMPDEIVQAMQPNVWVVDARRLTSGALVNLADRCLIASARQKPQPSIASGDHSS